MRHARRTLHEVLVPLVATVVAMVMVSALVPGVSWAARSALRPIVFVHGFFGSGSQFATQAKRFASNGYPATHVEYVEYDTLFLSNTRAEVLASLERRIARLRAATGADKVELVGHSLGTSISQEYLNSSPERAAGVAHYVNIDGSTATALPGGVPTLALWAEGGQNDSIPGATNVHMPNESHVENASSPASFAAMYRFFTGAAPVTTEVVPEQGEITLAGRAVRFPSNGGPGDAVVDVFEVDPATGRRTTPQPLYTSRVTEDGSFGPFRGRGSAHYEFQLTRSDTDQRHHLYFEPFLRTDLGVRLISSDPGKGVDRLIHRAPGHAALLLYRNKEWWGDQGAAGDTLTVNGRAVVNAGTAPRGKRAIALFAFDRFADRRSNPGRTFGLYPFLPFMTAVDLHVPATEPPAGSVTLTTTQRGGGTPVRLVVPDWSSATHTVTVNFNDHVH
ncbi:alpha/beta fold hydrolase [Thermomonospora umbrina]|uniref:Alpha/beta hydrolase family protein n=1 Tax=Thermomonospora umbrina TaxID=111806 RepID=A0A3D9SN06_9ACTN|nr:alpha/beta fold hydrolase [Thermomonospora umbrina]REE95800.1 alpha/beta hydrolase family protein [Thermomonospora umbrina]